MRLRTRTSKTTTRPDQPLHRRAPLILAPAVTLLLCVLVLAAIVLPGAWRTLQGDELAAGLPPGHPSATATPSDAAHAQVEDAAQQDPYTPLNAAAFTPGEYEYATQYLALYDAYQSALDELAAAWYDTQIDSQAIADQAWAENFSYCVATVLAADEGFLALSPPQSYTMLNARVQQGYTAVYTACEALYAACSAADPAELDTAMQQLDSAGAAFVQVYRTLLDWPGA